jgi:hypothetical protein
LDAWAYSTGWTTSETWGDQSQAIYCNCSREFFGGNCGGHPSTPSFVFTPDQWHHVLISFDISGSVSSQGSLNSDWPTERAITSDCLMWLAFDDVNYDGINLPCSQTSQIDTKQAYVDGHLEGNEIAPLRAVEIAYWNNNPYGSQTIYEWQGWIAHHSESGQDVRPHYSLASNGLVTDGQPFAIPAMPQFVNNIFMIEMAEFQMWFDKTLDTSIVANRRLFVDAKGKPVKPSVAQAKLGEPAILLHRSGNWIVGKDTGTLGEFPDSTLKADGQFAPTGRIKRYRPDPSLHGNQKTITPPGT